MAKTARVLLLSGGIESATLLYAEQAQSDWFPMTVDYGQRAAQRERLAADALCRELGLQTKHFSMPDIGEAFREGQSKRLHVPIPHRNLLIAALAVSYAALVGAKQVYLALNKQDRDAYPSASDDFVAKLQALARSLGEIDVCTPFAELAKHEIIALGLSLGLPYAMSYSCLLGYEKQCGACPQCLQRKAAFAQLALADPAGYSR